MRNAHSRGPVAEDGQLYQGLSRQLDAVLDAGAAGVFGAMTTLIILPFTLIRRYRTRRFRK